MGRKRKNRNSTENGGNAKRQKLDRRRSKQENEPGTSKEENTGKMKRRRTKRLRMELRTEIEKALKMKHSPIAHLFNELDEGGTPCAPFWDVVKLLATVDEAKIRAISQIALLKMSNITSMFAIYVDPLTSKLMISHRPVGGTIEDCTVYIDNLPMGCNAAKLNRLLCRFGTVVELKFPRTKSQKVMLPSGEAEVAHGRRSFAFVQFTEAEAAEAMLKAYERNAPVPGKPLPKILAMVSIRRHIHKYRVKSDRMSWMEIIALRRLRRLMRIYHRKEYGARRKARKKRLQALIAAGLARPRLLKPRRKSSKAKKRSIELKRARFSIDRKKADSKKTMNSKKGAKKNNSEHGAKTKKKRKRFRKHRYLKPGYIKGPVVNYFELIQVLPFAKYRELREEYIALRDAARKQQRHLFRQCQKMDDVCHECSRPEEFHERAWRVSDHNDCSDESFVM